MRQSLGRLRAEHTRSRPPLPAAPMVGWLGVTKLRDHRLQGGGRHTGVLDVVGFDFIDDGLGMRLALDILDAVD